MNKNYKRIGIGFFINLAAGWSTGVLITSLGLPFLLTFGALPIITLSVGIATFYASFMLIKQLTRKTQYDLLDDIKILEAKAGALAFLPNHNEKDNLSSHINQVDLLALQRKRTTKSLKVAGATLIAVWTLGSAVITSLALLKLLPAGLFIAGTLSGPIGIAFLIIAIAAAVVVFALSLKRQNSLQTAINGKNLLKIHDSLQQLETRCDLWLDNKQDNSSVFNKFLSLFYSPIVKTITSAFSTFSLFFGLGKLLAVIPLIAFVWTPPVWIIIIVALTFGGLGGIVSHEREKELIGHVPHWHTLKTQAQRVSDKLALIEKIMTPRIDKKSLTNVIKDAIASAWFEYQHSILAQISLRKQLRQLQQRAEDSHITDHLKIWLNNKIKEIQSELVSIESRTSQLYKKINILCGKIEELTSNKFQSIRNKNVFLGNILQLFKKCNPQDSSADIDEMNATILQINSEIHQYVRFSHLEEQPKVNSVNDLTSVCSFGKN